MILNLLTFINNISKEDYDRFIRFLNESRGYPYFSSLYDMDDFEKDAEYFEKLHIEKLLKLKKENRE